MRPLNVAKLPEFVEEDFCVSEWSTVRVKQCAYSVPSRLIGEWVRVRIFEGRIEVWYAGTEQLSCERLRGHNLRRIDYRHVIWSLVRKPGGFARYVYREEMFPALVFRRAYDAIQTPHHGLKGDLEYLRILHHAASTIEADVEDSPHALASLTASRSPRTQSRHWCPPRPRGSRCPELAPQPVDLGAYVTRCSLRSAQRAPPR